MDFTFAAASQGTDIDPEIQVYTKRALSFRRAYYVSRCNKKLIDENYELYKKAGEPGIINTDQCMDEQLNKMIAEEPGTSQRTRIKKECKPLGPVGFLLETVHMQASAMDDKKIIHQQTQAPIDLLNAAYQHITPMVRSAATRNRTRRAEGTRDECENLFEIDELATKAKTKKMERADLMILDMERTCSTWNQTTAYKAGQSQTKQLRAMWPG